MSSSRKLRVLVLYGGRSVEREVSVESAKTVIGQLDPKRYEILPVWIDPNGRWLLQKELAGQGTPVLPAPSSGGALVPVPNGTNSGRPPVSGIDVVFPVLHGPMGEDGSIQGLLELSGLPYVGCGILASAVGMDKEVAKKLAERAGVPVLPHVVLRSLADLAAARSAIKKLGLPLFIKPARLGSSVGIVKVKRESELTKAVRSSFRYDTKVLVEKGVEAREICCALLGEPGNVRASECGEILVGKGHEFFDYDAKYTDEQGHGLRIPAPLSPRQSSDIRRWSCRVFEEFECFGMARADFFVDRRTQKAFFGEINTIPGFTSGSLYPQLWKASGIAVSELVDRLIALALARHRKQSGLRMTRD